MPLGLLREVDVRLLCADSVGAVDEDEMVYSRDAVEVTTKEMCRGDGGGWNGSDCPIVTCCMWKALDNRDNRVKQEVDKWLAEQIGTTINPLGADRVVDEARRMALIWENFAGRFNVRLQWSNPFSPGTDARVTVSSMPSGREMWYRSMVVYMSSVVCAKAVGKRKDCLSGVVTRCFRSPHLTGRDEVLPDVTLLSPCQRAAWFLSITRWSLASVGEAIKTAKNSYVAEASERLEARWKWAVHDVLYRGGVQEIGFPPAYSRVE